jgi:Domain of unknown function (DUF4198)
MSTLASLLPARWVGPLALALACGAVSAHDTWFAAQPDGALLLATGNRFPVAETAVDIKFFARQGCMNSAGQDSRLALLRYTDQATLLRAPPAGSASCFMQLDAFDVELPLDKVAVYFKEIRPSAAVLAAWTEMRSRGLPFRERYVKSARIDLGAGSASPRPSGTAMDALRLAPLGALKVGDEATFQLLREGRPLADFNFELVNERSAIGLWHRTDAEGRVRAKLPLPGRWLLRGTDLRLAPNDPTRWEGQFITYAFDVAR